MDWRDKLLEHLKSVPHHSYMDYKPEPKTKGDVVREYAAKHNIPLVNLPVVQIKVDDLYGCVVIGPSDKEQNS